MPCFSLRDFDPHLPDLYCIKVGLVGIAFPYVYDDWDQPCPDANKMMLCYAVT